jgi:predicted RNase H-like HicB family nuclease
MLEPERRPLRIGDRVACTKDLNDRGTVIALDSKTTVNPLAVVRWDTGEVDDVDLCGRSTEHGVKFRVIRAGRPGQTTVKTPPRPHRYPILVRWSPQDKGFLAITPDRPEVSGLGPTQASAVQHFNIAMSLVLEDEEESGERPRTPRQYIPSMETVMLDVPKARYKAVKASAEMLGLSVPEYLLTLLPAQGGT